MLKMLRYLEELPTYQWLDSTFTEAYPMESFPKFKVQNV